jgi:hypothetical protein
MFTYTGKETTYITKICERTNLQIAYHTNNFIQVNLIPKPHISEKFSASGVYEVTCPDCGKTSIGQTDKTFPRDTQNIYMLSE